MIRPRLLAIATITGVCLATVGCQFGGKTDAEEQRERIETAEVRADLEPIRKRWHQLGSIEQAHWVGGTLTDDRVPGPSTVFVEAVVVLAPADVTRLTDQHHFAPSPTPPDPPASLRPFVRDGPWLINQDVNQTISPPGWVSSIYLQPANGVAYIRAKGQ